MNERLQGPQLRVGGMGDGRMGAALGGSMRTGVRAEGGAKTPKFAPAVTVCDL